MFESCKTCSTALQCLDGRLRCNEGLDKQYLDGCPSYHEGKPMRQEIVYVKVEGKKGVEIPIAKNIKPKKVKS